MASSDVIQAAALLVLVCLSSFFSSAETALTTASPIRLQALAEAGNKKAATVLKIKESPSKMLSSILIGNNLVNNGAAALATALAIRFFGNGAVGIVTGLLTILVLIFGEITPKTFATVNAEKMALSYGAIILFLMKLLTPVIYIINTICRFLLQLLGVSADNTLSPMTEMELRTVVDVSHKDGVIEKEERQMIYNVVDFGDSAASDVMVPRADMIAVSVSATYEEIREVFRTEKYTRLPVFKSDKDTIVGILNIKDFFFCNASAFDINQVMYSPHFTYEGKKTSELLMEMQKKSVSISIVLDEYGSAVGLVSLEDLLEEIVGEIRDEYDEDEKDLIKKLSDTEYLIEGGMKLDDINDALNISLDSDEYDSIGGFILEKLDHIPSVGETIQTDNHIILTVQSMDKARIVEVRMILPQIPVKEATEYTSAKTADHE